MIKLQKFSYGFRRQHLLADVNLEIPAGKVTALIGANGSGKSTLALILAGIKTNFRGQVWLDDVQLGRHIKVRTLRQKVGLVLQNPDHQLLFQRVQDDLEFILKNLNLPQADQIPDGAVSRAEWQTYVDHECQKLIHETLAKVGMADYCDANPHELSGGQKQRIAIASALITNPDYLILDEATAFLDSGGRESIYQLLPKLTQSGTGVLMITNILDELLLADEILIIDQQKLHHYTKSQILKNPAILEKHHFQIPLSIRLAKKYHVATLAAIEAKL